MLEQGRDNATVVFLGDYIDRGEQSCSVLDWLRWLDWHHGEDVICLRGNHEEMLIDFLSDPLGRGKRWLRNGGLQTLASYGVGGVTERSEGAGLIHAANELRMALPDGMEEWISELPLLWQSGDLVCVHAALDPLRSLEDQSATTLIWGHASFLSRARADGLHVAHGHTVVEAPEVANSRIAVDTGAYFTGILTAAAVYPGHPVRFLQSKAK